MAIGMATLAVVFELTDIWVTAQLPQPSWTPLPLAPEDMAGTAFSVFGAILVHSRPRLVIGWLLCAGGLSAAANILTANTFHLLHGDPAAGRPIINLTWHVLQLTLGVLLPSSTRRAGCCRGAGAGWSCWPWRAWPSTGPAC
ncbi:hypothetical protein BKM31_29300 [[Actinomadura] parvosata subsp. kistnae]|uniref:Uncharacterized protein n=1 Tax=[Actinomadura] parvosata subsp. kistnae TaxID=1909395 RepID=A0A1V0A461_9ACTN|nr:hypothetical protein BKM31_29300 [Nonomuraea sp. ATCC 55076]